MDIEFQQESDAARVFRAMTAPENPKTAEELLCRFSAAKRPAVQLAAALAAVFACGDRPENADGQLLTYIRRRLRPAAETLIELNRPADLKALDRLCPFPDSLAEELFRAAVRMRRTEPVVWLLQRKAERTGFRDRDFTLD